MVMKLHTGVPGAGKSYLLIKSFTDLFCDWDKDDNQWVLKPVKKGEKPIRLISNIEGLTLPHENLDVLISERCQALARRTVFEGLSSSKDPESDLKNLDDVSHEYYLEYMTERVRWFFDDNYQQSLAVEHQLIYLIEESQRYFDTAELGRKPWVRNVLYFFERHRHHGISMFFDTQHASKLHKGILALIEEEIRARPRTLSVMGEFKYNSFVDGMKTNGVPIIVKPDKRVFQAYQSMTAIEAVKVKNPIKKYIIGVVCVSVLGYFGLQLALKTYFPNEPTASVSQSSDKPSNKTPSGGSPDKSSPPSPMRWVMVSYATMGDGDIWVVHPIFNEMVPIRKLGLKLKTVNDSLYAFVDSSQLSENQNPEPNNIYN